MRTCGLTGGVGMGKSTAAGLLANDAACVIDADDLARQLVLPGQEALFEIRNTFGDHIVGSDGNLRRAELARVVFSDPKARQKLEAILHPRIRALWHQQLEVCRGEHKPLAVVVIPLLFETAVEAEFDTTICVACSAETQRRRLLARGWGEEHIRQRRAAQWPVEKKMLRADYVIWSEGSLKLLREQMGRILQQL